MVRLFDANFADDFARVILWLLSKVDDQRSASRGADGDDKDGAESQKSAIEETGLIKIAKMSDGPEITIDRGMEMKKWRSLAAAVLGALFSQAWSAPSWAEGGAGPEAMTMGNMCMVMFGYDMIHITAYQPGKSRSEYCAEIPTTGPTILVFDIENPAFRDMPLELRIIRDPLTPISKDTDLEALTEVYRPATKYTKGTFNLQHDFKNNGHYIGLVTLTRPNGSQETSEFKFMVGETLWAWVPQIAGAVLIAGIVFVYWKHTHPSSKKKDAAGVAAS